MIYEVILPKLGQTVEESRIVEWMKKEGDPVERGEVLFTVETDKAVLDVEATRKGFLRKVLAPEGQMMPVLSVVGLISSKADEDISTWGATAATSEAVAAPAPQVTEELGIVSEGPGPAAAEGRQFVSPRARKLAAEKGVSLTAIRGSGPNGRVVERDVLAFLESAPKASPVAQHVAEQLSVDLRGVAGSGPGGRIMKADVEKAVPTPAPAPAAQAAAPAAAAPAAPAPAVAQEVALSGIRAIIAQRMHESHQVTAPVTLTMEVDATELVALREKLKATLSEELGFAIGYNDLLMKMAAKGLRQLPYMNARLEGQTIRYLDEVHVGLAVDTERGLLVPVVRDVDRKGVVEIAREVRDLAQRARTGRALPDELSGGCFTITNLGMYDVDSFTPIINTPEAAILGVGRIKARPAVVDGQVVVRQMLWLSLTFDHRLVDGAPAARFLQAIKKLVESPYLLLA